MKKIEPTNPNAYIMEVKNDPRDKLEVEIGDTKVNEFMPQAKISRWDNEINFSMRMHGMPKDKRQKVKTENGVLTYGDNKKEMRIYNKIHQGEDALEFEWVYYEKPETNIQEFTLRFKELDFFYQPPLNEEITPKPGETVTETHYYDSEGNVLVHRPENVVGSYAVYYARGVSGNNVKGKDYVTGKAFHIFRPEAIDANGNKTWCTLEIDREAMSMKVTTPQEFLDNAVYPVVVDPTLGYTSIGVSLDFVENQYAGYRATLSESGVISKITCYFSNITVAHNTSTAIYYPTSTLSKVINGDSNQVSVTTDGWTDFNMTNKTLVVPSDYWLVVGSESTTGDIYARYDTSGPTNANGYKTSVTYAHPLPSSFSWTGTQARYLSIYATYENADLATDSFTRSDSDSMGSDWTEVSGDFDISSNTAISTTASTRSLCVWNGTFNANNANYIVQAICKTTSASSSGVLGRYVDSSNYYFAYINTFSQTVKLVKRVSGTDTEIGTYSGGYSTGTNYTLRLEMISTTLKVYVNGTERISVTDSSLTATGKPGLFSDHNAAVIDDFNVYGEEASGGGGSTFKPINTTVI